MDEGWCFFFEAEDGIRDRHVTGVKTCALPIWLPEEAAGQLSSSDVVDVVGWYLESYAEAGMATTHGQDLGDEALADGAGDDEGPL